MKKRYYNLLVIPALAVIVFCLFSGFSSSDPQDTTRSLIDQRMRILQSAAQREIPRLEAEKQLRKIEAESLLSSDLKDLREGAEVSDRPCTVKFKKLTKKKQFFQYITYEADLVWDLEDYSSEAIYNVVIKEENGGYLLTVFEPAKV